MASHFLIERKTREIGFCQVKKQGERATSDTSESSTASEHSIRRSTRIKCITVFNKRTKGHGLVKSKSADASKPSTLSVNDSDTSENSNSGMTEAEKMAGDSSSFATPSSGYDSDHKAQNFLFLKQSIGKLFYNNLFDLFCVYKCVVCFCFV